MDDRLVESLIFGIVCGAFCFIVTVAIENASVLRWAQLVYLAITIPAAQYVFGLPAVASELFIVVFMNAYISIVEALDAKKFADAIAAPAPATPKIRRFGDASGSSADAKSVKSDEELKECFS